MVKIIKNLKEKIISDFRESFGNFLEGIENFLFFPVGNICFLCYRRKAGKDIRSICYLTIISYHLAYLSQSFSYLLEVSHFPHSSFAFPFPI